MVLVATRAFHHIKSWFRSNKNAFFGPYIYIKTIFLIFLFQIKETKRHAFRKYPTQFLTFTTSREFLITLKFPGTLNKRVTQMNFMSKITFGL